ncbi:unnamed protein product [Plutella xylostella]|uniref:(diamondback moth) hypothetical protein n=1 Tax=Plutella xylostella TaxID=51655 RepID=A0A8S4G8E6_PLUXY|nr:unnamed protein product [Plutella xylostella]
MVPDKCLLCFVLVLFSAVAVATQNATITIPLNKPITTNNKELYGDFLYVNQSSTLQVNFSAVPKTVSFLIFQVHSHLVNVTLYNNTLTAGSYVVGTNIGLYTSAKKPDTFFIYNQNVDDVQIYVSVHGYKITDPIPGGCNMEFPILIAPYLRITYNREYFFVDGAAAKDITDVNCNSVKDVEVTFYRVYLKERDFSPESYFAGLKSVMTLDNVLENGEIIPETGVMWSMRRMLSAYAGTGAALVGVARAASGYSLYVPAVTYACRPELGDADCELLVCMCAGGGAALVGVARAASGYSLYVPAVTYACRPELGDADCELLGKYLVGAASGYSLYVPAATYACRPELGDADCELLGESPVVTGYIRPIRTLDETLMDDVLSQMICAALLFVGLFVCYFGHRFFKTEMFLIGMASGALVTYIIIAIIADLERPALVGASLLSGVFFGAIWLVFWWFYGIPVFAVLLSTLNLGFLIAAIVYYRLPGGNEILEQDFNFWTVFIFIMTLTSVTLISITFLSNLLCCCILGAYAIIYPIDFYIGGNLKYIIINTLRRATVPKFNYAVLSPPFQLNDALLTLLWVALAATGFLYQHYRHRGRPPFPPPPRSISPRMPEGPTVYGVWTGYPQRVITVTPQPVNIRIEEPARTTERTPLLA